MLLEHELGEDERRLFGVFESTGIARRHFAQPLPWFAERHTFGESNQVYVERGLELAAQAVERTLARANAAPSSIDHVVFVSSTGIATPSLDARLVARVGFRHDVRRTPIWGLGCAGGVAGLARAREFAVADPDAHVLLVALELCSLTFQRGDRTRRNIVAASLFADGAAAALVCGHRTPAGRTAGAAPALELVASRSTMLPDSLDVMGWDVDEHGLHVVFSRDIPSIVQGWAGPVVREFLAGHALTTGTLDHVVAHPGGPKVLAAYAAALGMPLARFAHAAEVLRTCGNMSSPTCLFVLERALASGDVAAGDHVLIAALGPGFASELVLARGAGGPPRTVPPHPPVAQAP